MPRPSFVLVYQMSKAVILIPKSETKIRNASSGQKSELEGKKWLLPRNFVEYGPFKLPGEVVMFVARYQGKPRIG